MRRSQWIALCLSVIVSTVATVGAKGQESGEPVTIGHRYNNASPAGLRNHVGEYRYADETSVVTLEHGKLFMKVGNDNRELRARSSTSFFAIESDREYTFNRKAGRTVSLTIQLPEFSYDSRKVR